jgi:hypothetical protein
MTDGHCFPSSMSTAAVTQLSVCVTADGFDHPIARAAEFNSLERP